jgi:hypothetical protein
MNTPTTDKFKFRTNGDPEWVVDAEVARGLELEVMRLRALLDEPQRKQIKPGPILDIPLDGAMECTKCGTPDRASLWFKGGYSPACPHCGAVFVCNAGRVG